MLYYLILLYIAFTYRYFQKMFFILICNTPVSIIFIFSGVLRTISSPFNLVLFNSLFSIKHLWHGYLQLTELYVNVTAAFSGRSPSITEINGKHHNWPLFVLRSNPSFL